MEITEFTVHILGMLGVQHAAKQLKKKRKTSPSDECFYFEKLFKKLAHFHEIVYRLPTSTDPASHPEYVIAIRSPI
jgi:hypothetical protein